MANNLLAHQVSLKKPIESNMLIYFENKYPQADRNATLFSYDLKNQTFVYHFRVTWKYWVFSLPKGDYLLLLERYQKSESVLLFKFLNEEKYEKSLALDGRYSHEIVYCNGYIYELGSNAHRCRVVDELGNAIRRLRWIKMPDLNNRSVLEWSSCIAYYDKLLITSTRWYSIYIYDEMVNSYSQLPVILRTEAKVLAVHGLKIFVITFSGPIYVNQGDLITWSILSLNLFILDFHAMVSSTYYDNNFYIANNGNFYKFWLNEEKLEKLELINRECWFKNSYPLY